MVSYRGNSIVGTGHETRLLSLYLLGFSFTNQVPVLVLQTLAVIKHNSGNTDRSDLY